MSHKIIEKEITWGDFVIFMFEASAFECSGYIFPINRVTIEKDQIVIYNGGLRWTSIFKEDNLKIKYGLGSFYFNIRDYDEKETENCDENGYPIFVKLDTYKLKEREVKLHQLKIFKGYYE